MRLAPRLRTGHTHSRQGPVSPPWHASCSVRSEGLGGEFVESRGMRIGGTQCCPSYAKHLALHDVSCVPGQLASCRPT